MSAALEEVRAAAVDGRILLPGGGSHATLVELMEAVRDCCTGSASGSLLARRLGAAERVLLILIDGLGDALLARHAPGGFLSAHRREALLTVFPSATATALTTVATGAWPGTHGVPGWDAWLPEPGIAATILPYVERASRRPLAELGVAEHQVFDFTSMVPRLGRSQLVVTKTALMHSPFSQRCSGGCPIQGYERWEQGIARVHDALARPDAPDFTYLYIPDLDALCHQLGVGHARVGELIAMLDQSIAALCAQLGGRARVLVTGDHGMTSPGERIVLGAGHPLLSDLRCAPTGESTAPIFHLRPGASAAAFRKAFHGACGRRFILLDRDEVAQLGLLGPQPARPWALMEFGDFLAVSTCGATLTCVAADGALRLHAGVHGGLSPAEMLVPLVVA